MSSPCGRESGEGETGGVGVQWKASVASAAVVVMLRAAGGSPTECGTGRGMEGEGAEARQGSQNKGESQRLTDTHLEKDNSGHMALSSTPRVVVACGVCTGSMVLSSSPLVRRAISENQALLREYAVLAPLQRNLQMTRERTDQNYNLENNFKCPSDGPHANAHQDKDAPSWGRAREPTLSPDRGSPSIRAKT